MTFTEKNFVIFLCVVSLLWVLTRGRYKARLGCLLAASLFFYGYRHWWWLPLMLVYCVADWGTGLWLERTQHRRGVLALGVTFNLAVLSFFKYTPLLISTLVAISGRPAPEWTRSLMERWTVPMGVSFYAFSGIAYMVDIYRREVQAEPNFWRYTLFTSFFPHLVAGPILRASEFLHHLQPAKLMQNSGGSMEGAFLIGRGCIKKMVLADSIAAAIDPFFAHVSDLSTGGVWSLPYVWLYAFQILFDFSGYTDIARGLGLWFGFRWPENFNQPYLARSVQDFWRRWHMTLSRFLRDYLYIPLGGNRHGPLRAALALMVTMLLGGLWHGANWSFMIWGGLHGAFLIINRAWSATTLRASLASLTGVGSKVWSGFCCVLTFHAICLAWCFFRLPQLPDSLHCIAKWFTFDGDKLLAGGSKDPTLWLLLSIYAGVTVGVRLYTGGKPLPDIVNRLENHPLTRGMFCGVSVGLVILAIALAPGTNNSPFIYFQF